MRIRITLPTLGDTVDLPDLLGSVQHRRTSPARTHAAA
jgi:hypothetical protein